MDLDALKTDLDTAFNQLSPEVLGELSRLVLTHKEIFAARLPAVMEGLMPHIKAGMMEAAMGILELKEVEDAVMEVLARHGVKPVTNRCPDTCEGSRCEGLVGHPGPHASAGLAWSNQNANGELVGYVR